MQDQIEKKTCQYLLGILHCNRANIYLFKINSENNRAMYKIIDFALVSFLLQC